MSTHETGTHAPLASPFELLQLPDGRCYVVRTATAPETTLIAGSFARLAPSRLDDGGDADRPDPVGVYASRGEAEIAMLRASPSLQRVPPLTAFAPWLRQE